MNSNPFILFLRLSRPLFLFGGVLQYGLGVGIARYLWDDIDWGIAAMGLMWILAGQLATHYLNEYYDAEEDEDNPNRTMFTGGSAVLGEGEGKLPRSLGVLAAAAMLTAVALLTIGLMRAGKFNLETSLVAALIFSGAIFYSVPPIRLAASGYGELTTAILIANLVPAFGYLLQTGEFHRLLAMSTFPLTAMLLAMMIAFEFPDYTTDLKHNKGTLLVRIGWRSSMNLHNLSIVSGFGLVVLAMAYGLPTRIALPALLPLPLGLFQIWQMARIANGLKPNWNILTFGAVSLFSLTAYILAFSFWTR